MSNRHLEDVSLTCILNHYILKTSSKRRFDIGQETSYRCIADEQFLNTLKNTSSRCKHYIE